MKNHVLATLLLAAAIGWQACGPTKTIGSAAAKDPLLQFAQDSLLNQPGLRSAQVGISLYDPATATPIFNYQGDKFFMPASNTKLFSLYAGMKYLGDSLTGLRYEMTDTALFILPTGDPTLLHPAYPDQPVIRFLQKAGRNIYLSDNNWHDRPLGRGWAWDDYNDDYMSERSPLPVYGNLIRWMFDTVSASFYSIPDIDWPVRFSPDSTRRGFLVQRDFHDNAFEINEGDATGHEQDVPFITNGNVSAALLLKDTIGRAVVLRRRTGGRSSYSPLHSRPVDSLFRPMMYNSDNFFAEQTLLMVSNEVLGQMNDGRIIDTLLNGDLKGLPQRPIWVDGCGLSRNDLFTPQDFIWLLDTMRKQFGLDRMKRILPTGGTGTLSSYYREDAGYIYAKTGSLSGVAALSGYLITKKDHLLLFSILVNNYTGSGVTVRRRMEQLIHRIRNTY
jgi:D-alanyl-D-alanine carboxypeptidase/D-alanyl-D-alanine-endopeptidase (penicillin-binding protein 4)